MKTRSCGAVPLDGAHDAQRIALGNAACMHQRRGRGATARGSLRRSICAWGCAAITLCAAPSTSPAADVEGVQLATNALVLPRGGVLMVPLTADLPGMRWPDELGIELADGRSITGHVGWMYRKPPPNTARWTSEAGVLTIRPIRTRDDSAAVPFDDPLVGPWLLADLPLDATGPVTLGARTVPATWIDLPAALPRLNLGRQDQRAGAATDAIVTSARAWPDPGEPMAWWRAVLLADRLGVDPPPAPAASEVEFLAALHFEQMWRIALNDLAGVSRGVAAQCRDQLTSTCRDGDVEFAAWVTDAGDIGRLLTQLLSSRLTAEQLAATALVWSDAQEVVLMWPERSAGGRIALAIANISPASTVARVQWSVPGDIPVAVTLAGGDVTRVEVDRPPPPRHSMLLGGLSDDPQARPLEVLIDDHRDVLDLGARWRVVRPPAAAMGPLHPELTLDDVRDRRLGRTAPARITGAELRHVDGHWELFAECKRPENAEAGRALPPVLREMSDLRGCEALTVLLRDPESSMDEPRRGHVVTIPEEGRVRVYVGDDSVDLVVTRRSHEDRWLVSIVLPSAWVAPGFEPTTGIALMRTHGDGDGVETSPLPCLPWRIEPAFAEFDLSQWDTINRIPERRPL